MKRGRGQSKQRYDWDALKVPGDSFVVTPDPERLNAVRAGFHTNGKRLGMRVSAKRIEGDKILVTLIEIIGPRPALRRKGPAPKSLKPVTVRRRLPRILPAGKPRAHVIASEKLRPQAHVTMSVEQFLAERGATKCPTRFCAAVSQ